MKNTNNYNLPLFESGDKFNKETINETNAKVDLAISDLQETFNANATGSALTTQEVINARKGKESLKDKVDEIDTTLNTHKEQMDSNIIKNDKGIFSNIKNKYRGASIYLPYREDLDGTFENNVNESIKANCNTIAICPIFWMNNKNGIIVGYKGTLTKEYIKTKCQYAKSKNLTVLIKPHVGGEGISSYGDINPTDIVAWLNSYSTQLKELVSFCKDYIDIVAISNEINYQSNQQYSMWKQLIDDVRLIKRELLLTNANTIGEIKTNVFLKDLDILGCNMYVGVTGDLSTNIEKQRASLFTTSSKLNILFNKAQELNKDIIITEVGILPFERSLASPETWGFTDNPPINYEAQVRYYKTAIREYINASGVIGVMVWNACDGFTFVNRPAQETLKLVFGGDINV